VSPRGIKIDVCQQPARVLSPGAVVEDQGTQPMDLLLKAHADQGRLTIPALITSNPSRTSVPLAFPDKASAAHSHVIPPADPFEPVCCMGQDHGPCNGKQELKPRPHVEEERRPDDARP
jgi:hypothetical protein